MLPTGEEADLRDREARERRVSAYPGYRLCRGYPVDHTCIVLIPWLKEPALCHGCMKTRRLTQEAIRNSSSAMPLVADVLEDLPLVFVKACPCGGDAESPYHEASLSHLQYAMRSGA